ncbi:MAG: YWFCY domain-containing protein [Sphingobacteriales bacterium]|nr:YWFCY domain-containing protein [Sphingobacteriales bacterium]OJW02015.1 MAG: conjugal transfer protein TraG [Sphingobacteriales bacterium 44-61]
MRTGENEMGLKKIIDMTRMIAIFILLLHFYYFCYEAFRIWGLTASLSDQLLTNITKTGLLDSFLKSKLIALGMLLVSLIGVKGKKSEKLNYRIGLAYLITGLLLYFTSGLLLLAATLELTTIASCYMLLTGGGVILVITGGAVLARIIKSNISNQVFNHDNEGFPQEERLLTDAYSLNLPARYKYKGKWRSSKINFLNARRSILVMGSAGSGKSYFIIENLLRQLIAKKQAVFVFDQKFPELTTLAYNHFLKHKDGYPPNTSFVSVNFTDPSLSHQCNPINPATLPSMISAIESSKSLLLSMNKTWANKQGEFFVDSPINLLSAVIWFLRKYEDGEYCTLPHAIELIHVEYDKLFTILKTEPEICTLINPFIQAYLDNEMETLNSQMASVKIPLGRISTPEFYYVLSGNDFTLDINDPQHPKIFCLGNNPQYQEALAPIMSLYIDRLNRLINQQGKYDCAQVLDEFASVRAATVMQTIITGRSNNITTIIAVQDYSLLKTVYSREEAETIFNITGNIISGQVSGETARLLSERFAKTFQDRQSISINSGDTSVSRSKQLEQSVPASTISSLSSGEFVGIVADNPDQPIEQKAFHSFVVNDHASIKREKENYESLQVVHKVTPQTIKNRSQMIKQDVQDIVNSILEQVFNDPTLEHQIVKRQQ